MARPVFTREAIIEAIGEFDGNGQRHFYRWQDNRYVVDYLGKHYPPKILISIATGRDVNSFSGGSAGANAWLSRLGFTIVDLAEVGREVLGVHAE